MTNEHPQLPPKGHYSQADLMRILGTSKSTLVRAVKSGLLKVGGLTNKKGERPRRYYLGKDVNTYWATR